MLSYFLRSHVRQYALHLSENTVRKRLKKDQIHPRRPATGPKLTAALRRACLNFALEHVNWVEQDWRRVFVFDKSRFCLYESDGEVIVSRRPLTKIKNRVLICCLALHYYLIVISVIIADINKEVAFALASNFPSPCSHMLCFCLFVC
jgi:hypothetical protein